MQLHGYSIYDRKSLVYHTPFFALTDGAALRSFSDLVNDASTAVGTHPNDYVLFGVGSWDDSAGQLLPATTPRHIADGNSLARSEPDLPLTGATPLKKKAS